VFLSICLDLIMGRTKSYNEDEVLDKALYCFWKNGYHNTSIRLLENEMGINQFSIYSSFKSKSHLYRLILRKYTELLNTKYLHKLRDKDSGLEEISKFLMTFGKDMKSGKIPSCCLMVRSILNYSDFDKPIKKEIDGFIDLISSHYRSALKNHINNGTSNRKSHSKHDVDYLVGLTQSISIMNQHMSTKQITNYIKNSVNRLN